MTKCSKMLKRTEAASLRKEAKSRKSQSCNGTNFARMKSNILYIWTERCMNAQRSKGNIWKGEGYLEELVASEFEFQL